MTNISLSEIRQHLYSAVVCDAVDKLGLKNQSPRAQLRPLTTSGVLVGRLTRCQFGREFLLDPRHGAVEQRNGFHRQHGSAVAKRRGETFGRVDEGGAPVAVGKEEPPALRCAPGEAGEHGCQALFHCGRS